MATVHYEPLKYDLPPYHRPNSQDEPLKLEHSTIQDRSHNLPKRRSWKSTIITQTFALLWIAPMLTLLILNLKGKSPTLVWYRVC